MPRSPILPVRDKKCREGASAASIALMVSEVSAGLFFIVLHRRFTEISVMLILGAFPPALAAHARHQPVYRKMSHASLLKSLRCAARKRIGVPKQRAMESSAWGKRKACRFAHRRFWHVLKWHSRLRAQKYGAMPMQCEALSTSSSAI